MARILSLETSTTVCSVALHENDLLLATAEVHIGHSHGSKLAFIIDQVVRAADLTLQDMDAVAVSAGPGSYTGLRIGASTAKGLCYALSIPLISVGSLELLAAQLNKYNVTNAWLCPMIDARRMEVYCCIMDASGNIVHPVTAKIIDDQSFAEYLENAPIIFFGDGAGKCQPVITHRNALFVSNVTPSAVQLGNIAFEKLRRNDLEDVVHFEPFYLKEFKVKKPADLVAVIPNKTA